MKTLLIIALMVVSLLSDTTYKRDYIYTANMYDSFASSKEKATKHILVELSQEIGMKIYAKETLVNSTEYTSRARTFTVNNFKVKTLKEKWNGKSFYLELQVTVDLVEAAKSLKGIDVQENTAKDVMQYYLVPHKYSDYSLLN